MPTLWCPKGAGLSPPPRSHLDACRRRGPSFPWWQRANPQLTAPPALDPARCSTQGPASFQYAVKNIWSEKSENRAYLPPTPSFSPIENTVYCITISSRWHTGLAGCGHSRGRSGTAPTPGLSLSRGSSSPVPHPHSTAPTAAIKAKRWAQAAQCGQQGTATSRGVGAQGRRRMARLAVQAQQSPLLWAWLWAAEKLQSGGAGHSPPWVRRWQDPLQKGGVLPP